MRTALASEPAPGAANEDFAAVTATTAVVLDGAAVPTHLETGCIHGIPWYVRNLAYALLNRAEQHHDLKRALSDAITDVAGLHQDTCQPTHPCSPSATIALARIHHTHLDWLVLGDAFLILDTTEDLHIISDNRLAQVGTHTRAKTRDVQAALPEQQRRYAEHVQDIRQRRNQPGGYWVAAGEPNAAKEALTGSAVSSHVHRLALMSDGAARLVDRFHLLDWHACLDLIDTQGPDELIRRTRQAETDDATCTRWPRSKRYDDATAALCRP